MAATCAGCLRAIPAGSRFVLSGTEVFHTSCAKLIPQSLAWRVKRKEAQLAAELAEAKALMETRMQRLRDAGAETERLRAECSALAAERNAVVRAADAERAAADQRRNAYYADMNRVTAERDQAIRERDAARREAALHQQLGSTARADGPTTAKDERDASEVRFSLLEIDKP